MSSAVSCECGHQMRVPNGLAGRRGRCPKCQQVIQVPLAPPEDDIFALADEPARPAPPATLDEPPPVPTRSMAMAASRSRYAPQRTASSVAAIATPRPIAPLPLATPTPIGFRRHLYWVLLVVLLPLAWSTIHPSAAEGTLEDRIQQTVKAHPESVSRLQALPDDASTEDLFAALPNDRLDGALLPQQTYEHWLFAAISGAVFLGGALVLFPAGQTKAWQLLLIGVATGTLGIFLLLAFQWLAFHMPLFRGSGWLTLLLDFVWLIGQSYRMALGDHGFVLSFLGFTAGVGFCEEACKALPLIHHANSRGFSSWRSALVWGLVSGFGFGVSEGITYSVDYYNGISGAQAYLVRFVSCVGLHGIWAAATGVMIFRRQDYFRSIRHPVEWIMQTLAVVIVPMILHGAYDTLLKQEFDGWALLVAVASFAWLAIQIERAQRQFPDGTMTAPRSRGLMTATYSG